MVVLAVESASLGRLSSSSASSEASSSADWPETVRVAVRVRPPLAREVSTEELTVRAPGEVSTADTGSPLSPLGVLPLAAHTSLPAVRGVSACCPLHAAGHCRSLCSHAALSPRR